MNFSLVVTFILLIGSTKAAPKYKIVKNGVPKTAHRLASLLEVPYVDAPASLYQPSAICWSRGINYWGYYGELLVTARYSKINESQCLQLCSWSKCAGLNYYRSQSKCELLQMKPGQNYIELFTAAYDTYFSYDVYCWGLTTPAFTTNSAKPITMTWTTTTTSKPPVQTTTTPGSSVGDDPNVCGKVALKYQPKTSAFAQRIVGGQAAQPHTWPWQVRLTITDGSGASYLCGGTLIDKRFVLTAAHCLQGIVTKISVVTGDHDRWAYDPLKQTFTTTIYKYHELYNDYTHANDIALIKLPTPAVLNDGTRLACLPTADVPAGTRCAISGWGTLASDGDTSNILQEAYVPIVDMAVCNDYSHYSGSLNKAVMTCAGFTTGGVDTCQGDSGGPLGCLKNGQWEVQGVVSFGKGCAEASYPGVYAKVTPFLDWIKTKMATM